MSKVYETAACVRFFGEDLDPEEITRMLGKNPTKSERKGDVIVNSKTGNKRTARVGVWLYGVERKQPGDLDAQISEIFGALSNDLKIWEKLSKKYRADVFVGIFMHYENEGVSLAPETLKMLAERNLLIDFDIYYYGDSEDECRP